MPKGIPNKKCTPEFKKLVMETTKKEKLGYCETAKRFGVRHKRVQDWERIYLTEEPEGFAIERRGRGSTSRMGLTHPADSPCHFVVKTHEKQLYCLCMVLIFLDF